MRLGNFSEGELFEQLFWNVKNKAGVHYMNLPGNPVRSPYGFQPKDL